MLHCRNSDADYMIDNLVRIGKIIGANDEKSNNVSTIFPRKYRFLSKLSGTATVTENSNRVTMTENVSSEIRQGDAVIIRDVVYRGFFHIRCLKNSRSKSSADASVCKQHRLYR